MVNKAKFDTDAFAFSLGGMRTTASFVAVPVIASDRINKARDARLQQVTGNPDRQQWPHNGQPATQGTAA